MKTTDTPLTHQELQMHLWEMSQGTDLKEMARATKAHRKITRFRQKHTREQRTTPWSLPDGKGNWRVVDDDGTVLAVFRRDKTGKLTLLG